MFGNTNFFSIFDLNKLVKHVNSRQKFKISTQTKGMDTR
jgi:hypothetical protein